jgi:hypothetical protein
LLAIQVGGILPPPSLVNANRKIEKKQIKKQSDH